MIFWLATVALLLLGSVFVVLPLLGHHDDGSGDDSSRAEANVKLYEERISELRQEQSAGYLDETDFEILVAELQRSLLQDTGSAKYDAGGYSTDLHNENTHKVLVAADRSNVSRLAPLFGLLLIPILAYGLYDRSGYHDDVQLSDLFRQAIHPSDNPQETSDLIAKLKDGIQQFPNNQWAWYFLGKSYSRLGMHKEAKSAYQSAILYLESEPDKVMAMSQFVLASFLGSNRVLTSEATAMADQVLASNPNELTVLRILATAAREKEDFQTAIDYWERLVRANPASSSARVYRSNITAAQKILSNEESSPKEGVEVVSSPQIEVQVALADELRLVPELRVFVAVHNAVRQGAPPLAVAQLTVAELPTTVLLDNSSAVGPFNLSTADTAFVTALVSQRGVANPQPGDYRVVSSSFNLGNDTNKIDLLITEKVY